MADKNFKVKSGLNIPITSAAILTTDSSGNISSTAVLPITAGGTGQTSATNAINALLPVQNGSTVNYVIQSDGSNINWGKLYNQTIKNNGTTVTPRGIVNIVGATFADDSGTDTTTITFTDTTGVSTSGGSTITTSSESTKGLIIKGAASQTADLQQWQIPNGNKTAWVDGNGQFETGYFFTNFGGGSYKNSGLITVNPANNIVPLVIAGASGQTSDLQQWRNSAGTVLASIDSNGQLRTPQILNIASFNNSRLQMTNTGSLFDVGVASNVALRVRGAASQTANLTEWQNSAGTVLASISAAGKITSSVDASINGITIGLGSATSASRNIAIGLHAGESFGGNDQNIAVGYSSGRYNYGANNVFVGTQAGVINGGGGGNNNVYLGTQSGYSGVGSGNIMIGYQAGQNTSGSNKLVIANSNTSTPLIGGDFSAKTLTFAGNVTITSQDAGTVAAIIKGATSQTADLQQWQNSSGTVLSKVDSSGSMFTTTATAGTNTTQVATTAFVKTAIDNLIASAPGTLDTLDEIAQALNDDPNFYTTITTLTNALAEQDSYTLMGVF